MKQVDFYLLSNQVNDAKFKLASRLANKLHRLNKKALLYVDDASQAEQLDKVMWTFSDTSFVPHDILASKPTDVSSKAEKLQSKLHIADQTTFDPKTLSDGSYDVLINLSKETPVFNHHFARIADIIEADESSKTLGRQRYKEYREQGFSLETHKIEL